MSNSLAFLLTFALKRINRLWLLYAIFHGNPEVLGESCWSNCFHCHIVLVAALSHYTVSVASFAAQQPVLGWGCHNLYCRIYITEPLKHLNSVSDLILSYMWFFKRYVGDKYSHTHTHTVVYSNLCCERHGAPSWIESIQEWLYTVYDDECKCLIYATSVYVYIYIDFV